MDYGSYPRIRNVDPPPGVQYNFMLSWNIHDHHLVHDTDFIAVHVEGKNILFAIASFFSHISATSIVFITIFITLQEGCGFFCVRHAYLLVISVIREQELIMGLCPTWDVDCNGFLQVSPSVDSGNWAAPYI